MSSTLNCWLGSSYSQELNGEGLSQQPGTSQDREPSALENKQLHGVPRRAWVNSPNL